MRRDLCRAYWERGLGEGDAGQPQPRGHTRPPRRRMEGGGANTGRGRQGPGCPAEPRMMAPLPPRLGFLSPATKVSTRIHWCEPSPPGRQGPRQASSTFKGAALQCAGRFICRTSQPSLRCTRPGQRRPVQTPAPGTLCQEGLGTTPGADWAPPVCLLPTLARTGVGTGERPRGVCPTCSS